MKTPVLVASENGRQGIIEAMALLRRGGAALDAVELGARVSEDDPEEHSVGYSGLPNVVGNVELDASIMDGRTLRAGAVAAVTNRRHPITLARRVMERLPHVLLVARGAELFADQIHIPSEDLRTDEAMLRWKERFAHFGLEAGAPDQLIRAAATLTKPLDLDPRHTLAQRNGDSDSGGVSDGNGARDDEHGTVNYLALDQNGNLASSVSTSGIAWKYPGRVGDSPVIGAGNYCDNRYGAVACTGLGELAIRASTARSLILYIKMGMSLHEAGMETLRDLRDVEGDAGHYMNIVALSPAGEWAGFTTIPGKRYLYMTADMDEPALADRQTLPSLAAQ